MRYVQKDPDNIYWTIDRIKFDDLIASKKDSAPGPDGIPYGAFKCAGKGEGVGFPVPAQRQN